jgi:hypothetical protein
MSAITYTPAEPLNGPTFQCPRCSRVHPYPQENGRPVRCECGWEYRNAGRGKIVETFHTRIGGY